MGVTLRDIARACAVDVSTVSRALRGDERVKPATRERVAAVALEFGYRPNLAAQHLVTGETRTVWMLLGGITGPQDHLPSQAASRYCQAHGYDLHVVMHHNEAAAHDRLLDRLQQHLADGAIIIASHLELQTTRLAELVADDFPLVFLDRHVPDLPVPAFVNDNRGACALLLERCRAAGATHVCSLFGDGNTAERERRRAVAHSTGELGLERWCEGDALPAEAVLAVIASSPPAIHGLVERQRNDLRDRRLLFACFDLWYGEPAPAEAAFVAVQDFAAMAEAASAHLLALLDGRDEPSAAVHLTPPAGIREIRPRF